MVFVSIARKYCEASQTCKSVECNVNAVASRQQSISTSACSDALLIAAHYATNIVNWDTPPQKQNRDQLWGACGDRVLALAHSSVCVCVDVLLSADWRRYCYCCCCWLHAAPACCLSCLPAPATRSLASDAMARKTGADCHTLKFNLCVLGVCAWSVCVCNSHALAGQTDGWTDELERRAYSDELTAFNYKQSKSEKQMK